MIANGKLDINVREDLATRDSEWLARKAIELLIIPSKSRKKNIENIARKLERIRNESVRDFS